MKVRLRSDSRQIGLSSLFDKLRVDYLFVAFPPNDPTIAGVVQSVPVSNIEVFLDRRNKWMSFTTALKSGALVFSGAPKVHFVETKFSC